MNPSGKFVLRIAPLLHKRLKQEARAHNTSLNDWIHRQLLAESQVPSNTRIASLVQAHFGEDLVGLMVFGSKVRDEMRANSDIDLLLVIKKEKTIDRQLYRDWDTKMAPQIGDKYSPQFSHLPDVDQPSSLWLEIAIEGEVLFAQSETLSRVVRLIRSKIADGQYVRKMSHGHPYWVRKELNNAK